jgi:hypothetical protein
MNQTNPTQELHDLLVTRNFDPESITKKIGDKSDNTSYKFNYKAQSGKDYGTAVVMINEKGVTLFFGDNLGKGMDAEDKDGWFTFIEQLKNVAIRRFGSEGWQIQDFGKLKYSLQGQAAIKEGLFESWAGTKTRSWNGMETEARLMIKHKRVIGENDARFRYIETLFVETAEGERYKLPFTKLSAGRAMVEHVRQGGKPYDIRGNHIAQIVEEMNVLSRFRRANQGKIFEGVTAQLVESAGAYYETLQHNLKSLSSKTGYTKYFEAWDPSAITDEDVIIEDLRHMFVEQNIDSRVEQALPLLARLQREQAMKEANIFESWADLIVEGTWALPDTKEKQAKLIELLGQELLVGPDAINATEQLNDLLGDDELFNRLGELASENADADAREIVLNRLEELKDHPDVAQVIGQLTNQSEEEPEQDVSESRGAEHEFETAIINPAWLAWESYEETEDNPLPPEPEKMVSVTVSYNTMGSHHAASWGAGGGSPEENPELSIVSVIDNNTGEQIDPDTVVVGRGETLQDKAAEDYFSMNEGEAKPADDEEDDIEDLDRAAEYHHHKGYHPDRPDDFEESALEEDPLIQLKRSAGMREDDMEEGWKHIAGAGALAAATALGGYAAGSHSPTGFSNTKGIDQFNKPTTSHVQPLKTQADLDAYNKTRPAGTSKLLNLPSDFEEEKQKSGNWLEGQYGHSGKMKPVEGGDADTISRLKFLSGITK